MEIFFLFREKRGEVGGEEEEARLARIKMKQVQGTNRQGEALYCIVSLGRLNTNNDVYNFNFLLLIFS